MTKNKVFLINNMNCRNCKSVLHNTLIHCNGVHDIKINQYSKTVTIKYDSLQIDEAEIIEKMSNQGYAVSEVSTEGRKSGGAKYQTENS